MNMTCINFVALLQDVKQRIECKSSGVKAKAQVAMYGERDGMQPQPFSAAPALQTEIWKNLLQADSLDSRFSNQL